MTGSADALAGAWQGGLRRAFAGGLLEAMRQVQQDASRSGRTDADDGSLRLRQLQGIGASSLSASGYSPAQLADIGRASRVEQRRGSLAGIIDGVTAEHETFSHSPAQAPTLAERGLVDVGRTGVHRISTGSLRSNAFTQMRRTGGQGAGQANANVEPLSPIAPAPDRSDAVVTSGATSVVAGGGSASSGRNNRVEKPESRRGVAVPGYDLRVLGERSVGASTHALSRGMPDGMPSAFASPGILRDLSAADSRGEIAAELGHWNGTYSRTPATEVGGRREPGALAGSVRGGTISRRTMAGPASDGISGLLGRGNGFDSTVRGESGPAVLGADDGHGDERGSTAQADTQAMQGDVYLDGALVGRWMSRLLNKEAGRPSAGPTGFDSRRNALFPGATVTR